MWIFEAEGDALKGKKYWLRPGQEYTIGRNPQSRIELSSFKTVSKTHVTIKVGAVTPGSVNNLSVRTSVSIQDHDSKFGTWLDGTDIKNKTVNATLTEHKLKFAKSPDIFHLSWKPYVLTNAGCRAAKIQQLAPKLEPFEVKIVKDYTDKTTHVMATKINTAKGLAALLHQKYIVSDLFADALVSSLNTIGDILDPDDLPDPMKFLPSREGYEVDFFRPNPARGELFKGITFIFLDEGQYNNLATPINAGMGKAVIFDSEGKTVNDLVNFAKTKGQVLLIRRNIEEGDKLCEDAAKRLGFAPIAQNALLEPVLRVDKSLLVKHIEVVSDDSSPATLRQPSPETSRIAGVTVEVPDSVERPPPSTATAAEEMGSPTPVRKPRLRPRTTTNTQIDLFDDFFNKTTPKQSSQAKQSPRKLSTISRPSVSTTDLFSEFTSPTKPSQPSQAPIQSRVIEEEDEEDYAPAATEMRKRLASNKEKNSLAFESDSESTPADLKNDSPSKSKGKKRPIPDTDQVLLAAKERKRVAMEQSKLAAEELANAMKEAEGLRNLGIVETFEVDLSAARTDREKARSARWNPLWNGRKNFKKFRKAKQSITMGVGRHMIPLVDYKGKSTASQDFFFPAPTKGYESESQDNSARDVENTVNDLEMEDTPVFSRSTNSQRTSTKSSSRSSRSNRSKRSGRSLFVMQEDSDNELGFDD